MAAPIVRNMMNRMILACLVFKLLEFLCKFKLFSVNQRLAVGKIVLPLRLLLAVMLQKVSFKAKIC
jgi:hypothetical protein